ncbi:response regulator [Cohnella xylanilytica]|uniref:Response regulator n=1 Tax=Cohnella xylanilytica TaxID=557555 RepID=A0A841TXB4_9BACL|nr:response regulator [Cohnella xylanilytica]MBB6692896.1 response regulator [Cohnella xylanilytica]
MYRVLIVEDEEIIREGFKRTIEWDRYGLEIAGEAKDGNEGLAQARRLRPHLIFVDIRMPGMDGLAFAEQAARLLPDARIVVVSGYKDYEYLRQSLHLGLFDYLLKPVDEDELVRVVENAVRSLDELQASRRSEIEASSRLRKSESVLHHVLLSRLAEGDLSPLRESMPDPYVREVAYGRYAVAVLRVDNYGELARGVYAGDEEALLFSAVNICEESVGADAFVFRQLGLKKQITVLKGLPEAGSGDGGESDEAFLAFQADAERLLDNFGRFGRFRVSLGLGRPYEGWEGIHRSYAEACEAAERTTFRSGNRLVAPSESAGREDGPPLWTAEWEELFLSVCGSKDTERAIALLDTALRSPEAEEATRGRVYAFASRLLESADQAVRTGSPGLNRDVPYWFDRSRIRALDSLPEIRGWIAAELARLLSRGHPVYWDSKSLIRDLRDYVARRFTSEEMTLASLSSKFGMNVYQICRLFKSEFGQNFHVFLTELKMEKAKEYLRRTAMPVQDIAFLVGYKETKYFFKVFKKHVGLTPSEYRSQS